jgi:hypothetical protein
MASMTGLHTKLIKQFESFVVWPKNGLTLNLGEVEVKDIAWSHCLLLKVITDELPFF